MIKYTSAFALVAIVMITTSCTMRSEKIADADSLSVSHATVSTVSEQTAGVTFPMVAASFDSSELASRIERESYKSLRSVQGEIFHTVAVNINLLCVDTASASIYDPVVYWTWSDSTNGYDLEKSFRSHLVVFETVGDSLRLVDQIELPSSSVYHLTSAEVSVDTYDIHRNGSAIAVKSYSKEEGAGDSGYHKENLKLYVLVGGKLTEIFSLDTRDDSFSSCECEDEDGYYESNMSASITVESSTVEGFYDLTVRKHFFDKKGVGEETLTNFRWTGDHYAAIEETLD